MQIKNVSLELQQEATLSISEVFGPTLQGEGKSQGMHTMFVRLGLCNLDCAWCDTPYTWDWTGKNGTKYNKAQELQRMSIAQLVERMPNGVKRVVVTGGEPMVQQATLVYFVWAAMRKGYTTEVETNGTLMPSFEWADLDVQFNVSPKLANSGVARNKAINIGVLTEYKHHGATFKFVVENNDCIREVIAIAHEVGIEPSNIWLMPQGRTQTDLLAQLPWLFDKCAQHGFNLSARLHVLAHNDKRGI